MPWVNVKDVSLFTSSSFTETPHLAHDQALLLTRVCVLFRSLLLIQLEQRFFDGNGRPYGPVLTTDVVKQRRQWLHWAERHHLTSKHRVGRMSEWRRFQAAHLPLRERSLDRLQKIAHLKTVVVPELHDYIVINYLSMDVTGERARRQPLAPLLFFGIAETLVHWMQLRELTSDHTLSMTDALIESIF